MQGDCLICSSGSPTKRLLQITDMSWGRLAHVPAVYRVKPMSCLRSAVSGDNWMLFQVQMELSFFCSGGCRLSNYPISPCVGLVASRHLARFGQCQFPVGAGNTQVTCAARPRRAHHSTEKWPSLSLSRYRPRCSP